MPQVAGEAFHGRRSAQSCRKHFERLLRIHEKITTVHECTGGDGDVDERASELDQYQAKIDHISKTQSIDFGTVTPEVIRQWDTEGWFNKLSAGCVFAFSQPFDLLIHLYSLGKNITRQRSKARHSGVISDYEDNDPGDNVDDVPVPPVTARQVPSSNTGNSKAAGYQVLSVAPHKPRSQKAVAVPAGMSDYISDASVMTRVMRESMEKRTEILAQAAQQRAEERQSTAKYNRYKQCKDLVAEAAQNPDLYPAAAVEHARKYMVDYMSDML